MFRKKGRSVWQYARTWQYARIFLFLIPLSLGIVAGIVLTSLSKAKTPAAVSDKKTRLFAEETTNINPATDQFVNTASALLAKAVTLSSGNVKNDKTAERNQEIIKLINEAIDTINKGVLQYPNDPRVWAQRAKIYQTVIGYQPEAKEAAIADWQMALKLDPANKKYRQNLIKLDPNAPEKEIALPDSPPILEARQLAGPIIASPQEDQVTLTTLNTLTSNALSGEGIIPAGQTEVKICNDNLSPTAQVYLSGEDNLQGQVLFVKRKAPFDSETGECSHFVAAIQKPVEEDLKFDWWLIDI